MDEMMDSQPSTPIDAPMPMDGNDSVEKISSDFNLIISKPFSMSDPDLKPGFDKINSEVMDKVDQWDNQMSPMFGEYEEYTDSWRIQSSKQSNRPKALFNSKSGETHRAVETRSTLQFRMLTGQDPFYYAQGEGLDDNGNEVSQIQLQAVEQVIRKQLQFIRFKEKLDRSLRSRELFGTMIVECPWTSFPYGDGSKQFEGTDFIHRSLITTGFNPFVFDLQTGDYIIPIDYPSITMLRNWAKNDPVNWNLTEVERIFRENSDNVSSSTVKDGKAFSRVMARKSRAGYSVMSPNVRELVNYHGRLDADNPAIQKYWESTGRQDDPSMCDFSTSILDESGVVKFHATPFRRWQHLFKMSHTKLFEMEPLGYGVGKIGRKRQRELDATESRANDLLMFSLLSMWKIGKYAGVDVSKLQIKPWNFVELENIDQLEPLRPQIEALAHAINVQGTWKQDFRASNQATDNMQGLATGGTATESSIIQNASMMSGGKDSEITAESFLGDFLATCHINNVYFMDNGFWVKTMGSPKPFYVDKTTLPFNVGFVLKLSTDKEYRPQRVNNIMEALKVSTHVNNLIPSSLNVVEPLYQELFRALEMNLRLLEKPLPVADQMLNNIQRMQRMKRGGGGSGVDGSMANGVSSSPAMVETSPLQSEVATT